MSIGTILPPEMLDKIFDQWIKERNKDSKRYSMKYKRSYQRESRYYNQPFEDWLWSNGFTVIQDNHKRYLKFTGDEKKLTYFLLSHDLSSS